MTPTKPEHFIGKTGTIAKVLFHKLERIKSEKLSALDRRYLFTGDAGTGKTSLAMAFASAITGNSVDSILNKTSTNVDWINGQSATVEVWRKWGEQCHYIPMYGNRIVQIVDEVDSISLAAANESLSYLDALPFHIVFIATTNKSVEAIPDRMQSRFKIQRFTTVPEFQLASWLGGKFNINEATASDIAEKSRGNVRAAMTDALSIVETMEALAV